MQSAQTARGNDKRPPDGAEQPVDTGPCDRQAAATAKRCPRRREGARRVVPGEEDLVSRLQNAEEGQEVRRPRPADLPNPGDVPHRQHGAHRQKRREPHCCSCSSECLRVVVSRRRQRDGELGCFHRGGGQEAEAEQGGDPAAGAVRGRGSQPVAAASVCQPQPVVGRQHEAVGG